MGLDTYVIGKRFVGYATNYSDEKEAQDLLKSIYDDITEDISSVTYRLLDLRKHYFIDAYLRLNADSEDAYEQYLGLDRFPEMIQFCKQMISHLCDDSDEDFKRLEEFVELKLGRGFNSEFELPKGLKDRGGEYIHFLAGFKDLLIGLEKWNAESYSMKLDFYVVSSN